MTGSGRLDSCRGLFKNLHILPLQSQHIFSILLFVVKNRNYFRSNTDIHDNTRFNHNLHLPSTNLSIVHRGLLFSGSRIYNHLPSNIKLKSENIKEFKLLLKTHLTEQVFYSIDEYYKSTSKWTLLWLFLLCIILSVHMFVILLYCMGLIHKFCCFLCLVYMNEYFIIILLSC
jgi:hypothetical protein